MANESTNNFHNKLNDDSLVNFDDNVLQMFNKIALSKSAYFKSQQIDEPDLELSEKLKICSELMLNDPNLFLSRYGVLLEREDLIHFRKLGKSYELEYHIRKIEERLRKGRKIVKNRRVEALKQLSDQSYFSDSEMQKRNPLLFEQMIGQYMTDQEKESLNEKSDGTLSAMFMQQIDNKETKKLYERQLEEECSIEEEEDDDEEQEEDYEDSTKDIDDRQKELFRQEFVSLMKQNFLDGNDVDFNYSDVDNNEDYDSLHIKKQDAEDEYFDSEEPT